MAQSSGLFLILHVAGAVALLLWAVRLIRTGVERAFARQLRGWLRGSARSRFLAAATGAMSAIALQSSTAVALLISGFVGAGSVGAATGIAIMLGADLGSAVVASVLLSGADLLVPALLLFGVVLFLRGPTARVRQIGRILIGLALVFVSLDLIRDATAPLGESTGVTAVLTALTSDLPLAFILGAAVAWAMHSSVAAILFYVTLAAQGVLPPAAAMAMILGANAGGALIAVVLTLAAPPEVRRVTTANLVMRASAAAFATFLLSRLEGPLPGAGAQITAQLIGVHIGFNVALALLFLPLIGPAERLATLLHPLAPAGGRATGPRTALDNAALDRPEQALALARREVLRIGETVEAMLRTARDLFQNWDETAAANLQANEAFVAERHHDVKLFLASLSRRCKDEPVEQAAQDLARIAVDFETASDAISGNLRVIANRLHAEGLRFSDAGQAELSDFHNRVLVNAQLALDVLMTGDPDTAHGLMAKKDAMRGLENELQHSHLARLRDGRPESLETSAIHQETLRSLKLVNTSFSMVAYPLLHQAGRLLTSRLT
ncbi:phosphate:Na+ symporter [Jannaschia faecimaris]|uniref:Phosphate:Na+ symporter n=1 Tax=Jannaschia faecimaris TaxID=1244108 RepID=A0A1H3T8K1_9RHOB|nr:Na/Pi cotransporter family protein [Jannaschia faecimaris]SDZ45669.1 phosphate:Na+ symporter [Jannaschia faecimaris]